MNGVEGSLDEQRDWFYFVNGIEPDHGGAEVKLRPGDVLWWDYRDWREETRRPVVVGAFPEPFLHGWDGKRRPAEVRAPAELDDEAAALLETLGGADGGGRAERVRASRSAPTRRRRADRERGDANGRSGDVHARRLARRSSRRDDRRSPTIPTILRYRYDAEFDETGAVVG